MELRWDPLRGEWIIVSGKRGERPVLKVPKCPFCPGSEEVPDANWRVKVLPNRFPSLDPNPPPPSTQRFYQTSPARGICEVILYTPEHDTCLAELPVEHIKELIDLWASRYEELSRLDYVKYVYIFENRGREIGVTLAHPHGQLYAFPFIPPIPQRELENCRGHWEKTGRCLLCDILEEEKKSERVVDENEHFLTFLPFFARLPYGVHLYPKRHVQALHELSEVERFSLADALKEILTKFDNLFGFPLPYMMILHQRPTDGEYPYYHFHIEFYSPYRERDKLKFFASVETAAGTITFDYEPEEKAAELRRSRGYRK
ncbi:MAG: galactose-1-phosphate uridylyltransferase [Candidatus Hadarchaeales archaeon]